MTTEAWQFATSDEVGSLMHVSDKNIREFYNKESQNISESEREKLLAFVSTVMTTNARIIGGLTIAEQVVTTEFARDASMRVWDVVNVYRLRS